MMQRREYMIRYWRVLIVVGFLTGLGWLFAAAGVAAMQPAENVARMVVLSSPQSKYYPLAVDIAQTESIPLAASWEDALAGSPAVVYWVTSPGELSDSRMAEVGLILKSHGSFPAVGIITGGTLEDARQLWQRGRQLREEWAQQEPDQFYAANGEFPTAEIDQAQLLKWQNDGFEISLLNKESLSDALQQADYLTFTGHGAGRYLRLNAETEYMAADLPLLPPVVMSAASCQTLHIWNPDSIALGFIRQGAAAYVGFVFSPMEGFLMGEFQDLPFRYTWPDFPIGQVVALHNRGTLQGFAQVPFYYLLGDPLIAFRAAPPYELVSDIEENGGRTLVYQGAPAGIIPVRVAGGGSYSYVEVVGVGATSSHDPVFHSRLQATSLNSDQYILFQHKGGDFTIRLAETPPWGWGPAHLLLFALDEITLFMPLNGGDWIIFILGCLGTAAAVLRFFKLRRQNAAPAPQVMLNCLGVAFGTILVLGVYAKLREPYFAGNSKPVAFELNWLWLGGVFLLACSGSGLFMMARKWIGKFAALLVIAAPALFPVLFGLVGVEMTNLLIRQQIGVSIYSSHLYAISGAAAGLWLVIVLAILLWMGRRVERRIYTNSLTVDGWHWFSH